MSSKIAGEENMDRCFRCHGSPVLRFLIPRQDTNGTTGNGPKMGICRRCKLVGPSADSLHRAIEKWNGFMKELEMNQSQRDEAQANIRQVSIPSVQVNAANPLVLHKRHSYVAQHFGLKRNKREEAQARREGEFDHNEYVYDLTFLPSQDWVDKVRSYLETNKIPHRFLEA